MRNNNKHISYFAFIGHRLSGLALALFLPVHFLVLAMALHREQQLDQFLRWADQPLVKFAEWGLITLLTIHLGFGLRLLVIENLPWSGQRKNGVWVGAMLGVTCGVFFLLRSFT